MPPRILTFEIGSFGVHWYEARFLVGVKQLRLWHIWIGLHLIDLEAVVDRVNKDETPVYPSYGRVVAVISTRSKVPEFIEQLVIWFGYNDPPQLGDLLSSETHTRTTGPSPARCRRRRRSLQGVPGFSRQRDCCLWL